MTDSKFTFANVLKESYGPESKRSEAVKRLLKRKKKKYEKAEKLESTEAY